MRERTRNIAAWMFLASSACAERLHDGDETTGEVKEPWCQGFTVQDVRTSPGTVLFVAPELLAESAEGWGPQTLSLSVDKGFSPQVTYQDTPSLSAQEDKVTATVQTAVGYSLTHNVNLIASTAVLVPTEGYYRLEAYPQYQVVNFDVVRDPCGPMPSLPITTGNVYRPFGIYFRVMVFASGVWNALAPPSPAQSPLPPALAARLGIPAAQRH